MEICKGSATTTHLVDKPANCDEAAEKNQFYLFTTRRHGGRLTDGGPTQRDGVITAGLDARWRSGHAAFTLRIRRVKGYISEVRSTHGVCPAARSAILIDG